jgi:hypothetical protein
MSTKVYKKSLLDEFIDEIKLMREEGRQSQNIHI